MENALGHLQNTNCNDIYDTAVSVLIRSTNAACVTVLYCLCSTQNPTAVTDCDNSNSLFIFGPTGTEASGNPEAHDAASVEGGRGEEVGP